jgi:hypothetical protein
MTTLLSNEEKTTIVNQHLRNLQYSQFNLEMSLVEENAKTSPEPETIASLNSQLADIASRATALESELAKLV